MRRISADAGGVIHLLYFRLRGARRFEDIHGDRITDVARTDLTRRFAALGRVLLRQHDVLSDARSPAFGVWAIPFQVKRLEIDAGAAEQLESIAAAGRELGRAMLEKELGSAVALHAGLEVETLELEGASLDPAEWLARIRTLPRVAAPRPERLSSDEREALLEIIAAPVEIRLQSIVSLESGAPAAFEALARGPAGGPWHEPDRLFEAAARGGLRKELELACFESALELVRRLPAPLRLGLNLSPDLYGAPAVRRLSGVPGLPRRLILEVTEHLPLSSPDLLLKQLGSLRRDGAKLALDDAGCGYLNMDLVRSLRPDIVKLCITVTRRIGGGPEILGVIRETVAAIRAEGAEVLAEGVESEAQARLARECGCVLAQGFYFDAPRRISEIESLFSALRLQATEGPDVSSLSADPEDD